MFIYVLYRVVTIYKGDPVILSMDSTGPVIGWHNWHHLSVMLHPEYEHDTVKLKVNSRIMSG